MGHKIEGSCVILAYLSFSYIESYIAQFSSTIQNVLHVNDVNSERAYLVERCTLNSFFYVIHERNSNSLIGALEIRDPGHASQLYCWINEQFWGRGYFKEALQLAVREYVRTTSETILSACVDEENTQSLMSLQACGFKKKGTRLGPHGNQYILELHIDDIL